MLRFGQVVREVKDPGLYYKLPLIDNVVYFDKRILDLNSAPLEIIASDQKRLVVDAWGRYRIVNPLTVLPVGRQHRSRRPARCSVLLNSAPFGRCWATPTFIQLVRDERAKLMARITTRVDREAQKRLGVEVVDVKIQRADLPEANSQAIYERMQTERQQEATQIRALGEQQARQHPRRGGSNCGRYRRRGPEGVGADCEAGRGGPQRACSQKRSTPTTEFFAFYRSMQAYAAGAGRHRHPVGDHSPDSEFFRFFNDLGRARRPAAESGPSQPARDARPGGRGRHPTR